MKCGRFHGAANEQRERLMIRMTRVAADAQHGSGTMTTDRVDHQQARGRIIIWHRAVDRSRAWAKG